MHERDRSGDPGKYESKRSLDYTNLVASCNTTRTCGTKKENDYEEAQFVSPLNPECEDKFTYYPNGTIEGDEYTIGLLNLNDYELRKARESIFKGLQGLDRDAIEMYYINSEQEEYPAYFNVIKWYLKTL